MRKLSRLRVSRVDLSSLISIFLVLSISATSYFVEIFTIACLASQMSARRGGQKCTSTVRCVRVFLSSLVHSSNLKVKSIKKKEEKRLHSCVGSAHESFDIISHEKGKVGFEAAECQGNSCLHFPVSVVVVVSPFSLSPFARFPIAFTFPRFSVTRHCM